MTTDTTNLKRKSFLFSKACSTSCVSQPGQVSSLFTSSSNWSPENCLLFLQSSVDSSQVLLFPKLNHLSYAHYSEYHSISAGLYGFLLKIAITICKPCLPQQVWVLLIHSHYAASESLVKYKPQYASPHGLQNEVPTYQTGMPSLTRFLPSIPDPSLGASTPPRHMPCNPATQTCTAHKSTLLFSFGPLYIRALCPRKPFLGLCTRQTPTQSPSAELTASFLCPSQALRALLSSPFHNLLPCFAVCINFQNISSSEVDTRPFFSHVQTSTQK